jgi:hypothetical protein
MKTTDDEPWILRIEERELDRFSRRQQNAALKFPETARFARPHLIVTLPQLESGSSGPDHLGGHREDAADSRSFGSLRPPWME